MRDDDTYGGPDPDDVDRRLEGSIPSRFWGYDCPAGPHRRPEGPCEDVAVCPRCLMLSWSMRPPGECFGHHAPDCSLPERHESFCAPGGAGHPTGHLRGYPEFTWEAR